MTECSNPSCNVMTRNKRFCSRSCSAVITNAETPRRVKADHVIACLSPICEKPFLETKKGRRFCNTSCRSAYDRHKKAFDWMIGEEVEMCLELRKKILIEERGAACEVCGWSEVSEFTGRVPVQMDHRNGVRSDNSYLNLRLLCPNHHALTETWGYSKFHRTGI